MDMNDNPEGSGSPGHDAQAHGAANNASRAAGKMFVAALKKKC